MPAQSLFEAITFGLTCGPMNDITGNIEREIKEFFREKFGVAVMRAGENQETLNALYSLGAQLGITEVVPTTKIISGAQEQRLNRIFQEVV